MRVNLKVVKVLILFKIQYYIVLLYANNLLVFLQFFFHNWWYRQIIVSTYTFINLVGHFSHDIKKTIKSCIVKKCESVKVCVCVCISFRIFSTLPHRDAFSAKEKKIIKKRFNWRQSVSVFGVSDLVKFCFTNTENNIYLFC